MHAQLRLDAVSGEDVDDGARGAVLLEGDLRVLGEVEHEVEHLGAIRLDELLEPIVQGGVGPVERRAGMRGGAHRALPLVVELAEKGSRHRRHLGGLRFGALGLRTPRLGALGLQTLLGALGLQTRLGALGLRMR